MTPNQINVEICRALGVSPSEVQKLVLVVEPGKFPVIHITRLQKARDVDGLHTLVQMLELKPVPKKP